MMIETASKIERLMYNRRLVRSQYQVVQVGQSFRAASALAVELDDDDDDVGDDDDKEAAARDAGESLRSSSMTSTDEATKVQYARSVNESGAVSKKVWRIGT